MLVVDPGGIIIRSSLHTLNQMNVAFITLCAANHASGSFRLSLLRELMPKILTQALIHFTQCTQLTIDIYWIPYAMRFFALSFLLASLALATCGRNLCITNATPAAPATDGTGPASDASAETRQLCINLNRATAEDLMRLPGIGQVMARRIIDYRERHGRFRRPEEIIIIEGFSESKYRAIARRIYVE